MDIIRVVVIGVGYLGGHHARILSDMPEVELVGVVDSSQARAKEIAEKYNTVAYSSIEDIIDKIDAAVVAVPTVDHYDVSLELINAGKNLLIEKPIAATLSEATKLVDAAEEKNVILQIGHLERFNGAIIGVADFIKAPLFIESHRLGPFAARGIDVDVALDLMIHDIDVLLSIIKSKVVDIKAVGVPVLSNNIDIANARIEFESGCVANITASRVSVEKMRKVRIFQHDSYLSLDYQKQELKCYKMEAGKVDLAKLAEGKPLPGVEILNVPINKGEPLQTELKAFVDCIQNRSLPVVSGKDGRDALAVAIEIKEKAKEKLERFES